MNVFIIILVVAIVSVVMLYFSAKNAQEIKEEEPRFKPRKVTYTKGVDPYTSQLEPVYPKKKYYKKRNKKKKPAVANNETVEKRPVGRPRKTAE
jgi:flagellar basal body-associated protein FliL